MLKLPILFVTFWFWEAPIRIIRFLFSVNHATLQILSLPLMLGTFFKPLKNEYRKGLVGFSIGMGIVIKSVLIFVDSIIYLTIISFEIVLVALFVIWPILTVLILFI